MSTGWVAAMVRGRGLARRALGDQRAREIASLPSLRAALSELAPTVYGRELRSEMDLATAQHAVSATVLWHLRILAGWGPPQGAQPTRLLASDFEIANVAGLVASLRGERVQPPYSLGSLSLSWPTIARATTPGEVRVALRSSSWGDPGSDDLGAIRVAMQMSSARMLLQEVPDAAEWAISQAALLVAKLFSNAALSALSPSTRRDATIVLGPRWQQATSLAELTASVPRVGSACLRGVESEKDLWRAEIKRWAMIEATASGLISRTPPSAACVVGVAGVLAADAWRICAALSVAAFGGGDLPEVLDDVA